MHHPQVVQSPIVNHCLKVNIDFYTEPQLATNVLLQVLIQELHNNIVGDIEDSGPK